MTQLIKITRNGPNPALQEQFRYIEEANYRNSPSKYTNTKEQEYISYSSDCSRSVLRVLLENLEDEDGSTRALVFGVLTEMLKQVSRTPALSGFIRPT